MMTAPGAIAGTVPYMSPEQIRGEDLDECSDIFSFGILLHQALTGEHPFIGPSVADTVSAILTRDPPRHSRIGARHADPRRQQRHIVLRPARSPSPFRTSSV